MAEVTVTHLNIEELGPQGDGSPARRGHAGREPIYVERAIPGDRIKARIFKDQKGFRRGEILEILSASPHRQAAPCVHYEVCGNCTLQHLSPIYYRRWKMETVKAAFDRHGMSPRRWLEPVFLGDHNRRRVTFSAKKTQSDISVGYYRRRSNQITDIDSCLIAEPTLFALRDRIKRFLQPLLKTESVDISLQLVGEVVDMVITGRLGRPRESVLALLKDSPIARISSRASETDKAEILGERRPIVASFGQLKIRLPPGAFLQPTLEGEHFLTEAVLQALPEGGKFADLFSGCGTFSGPMLDRGTVDAFELVPGAVRALSQAGVGYPLRVFRRDLFRHPLSRAECNRYDAIVFDPPRAGCAEQAVELSSSKAGRLIGVSCNPATFARDSRILCDGGYHLQSLQIVDQFLWSHHVEVIGVFTRQKRSLQ